QQCRGFLLAEILLGEKFIPIDIFFIEERNI
ncbi:MAG: hypothetical protein ACI81Y_001260, partial [Glaciecola sp.]